jgi:hypothetical protein
MLTIIGSMIINTIGRPYVITLKSIGNIHFDFIQI